MTQSISPVRKARRASPDESNRSRVHFLLPRGLPWSGRKWGISLPLLMKTSPLLRWCSLFGLLLGASLPYLGCSGGGGGKKGTTETGGTGEEDTGGGTRTRGARPAPRRKPGPRRRGGRA